MLGQIRRLLEFVRFSHTLFALPFALLSALMAWTVGARSQVPVAWRGREVAGILVCMVMARNAAMAFNRIVDRRLDARNPRTAARHIPTGLVTLPAAWTFALLGAIGFVAGTLLLLPNWLPLALSLPVLAFILGYSYAKRFTAASHFWLGAALMLAPVSAWIAIRGDAVLARPLDLLPALVLGGAVWLWVAGFDMIYACQDASFDRREGLYSVPATWGVRRALRAAALSHAGAVILLALLPGCFPYLGWIYRCGVAIVAALLIYEHALVRPDDLTRVNMAFFRVNAIISMGLLAVGAVDLLLE